MTGLSDFVPWTSEPERQWHFRKHGLSLRTPTVEAYDASARGTIRAGRRFTYRQWVSGQARVGYYDPATQRLTILNARETRVVSHFRCPESYVRGQDESNYQR